MAAVPQLMGTTSKKKKSDKNENREDNGLASTPYATFEKDGVEFSNPVAGGLVAPLDLVKDGGSVAATNGKSRLSRDSTDSWDDNTLKAPLAVDAGVPPTPTSPDTPASPRAASPDARTKAGAHVRSILNSSGRCP